MWNVHSWYDFNFVSYTICTEKVLWSWMKLDVGVSAEILVLRPTEPNKNWFKNVCCRAVVVYVVAFVFSVVMWTWGCSANASGPNLFKFSQNLNFRSKVVLTNIENQPPFWPKVYFLQNGVLFLTVFKNRAVSI